MTESNTPQRRDVGAERLGQALATHLALESASTAETLTRSAEDRLPVALIGPAAAAPLEVVRVWALATERRVVRLRFRDAAAVRTLELPSDDWPDLDAARAWCREDPGRGLLSPLLHAFELPDAPIVVLEGLERLEGGLAAQIFVAARRLLMLSDEHTILTIVATSRGELGQTLTKGCAVLTFDYPTPATVRMRLERRALGIPEDFADEILTFVADACGEHHWPPLDEIVEWIHMLLSEGFATLTRHAVNATVDTLISDPKLLREVKHRIAAGEIALHGDVVWDDALAEVAAEHPPATLFLTEMVYTDGLCQVVAETFGDVSDVGRVIDLRPLAVDVSKASVARALKAVRRPGSSPVLSQTGARPLLAEARARRPEASPATPSRPVGPTEGADPATLAFVPGDLLRSPTATPSVAVRRVDLDLPGDDDPPPSDAKASEDAWLEFVDDDEDPLAGALIDPEDRALYDAASEALDGALEFGDAALDQAAAEDIVDLATESAFDDVLVEGSEDALERSLHRTTDASIDIAISEIRALGPPGGADADEAPGDDDAHDGPESGDEPAEPTRSAPPERTPERRTLTALSSGDLKLNRPSLPSFNAPDVGGSLHARSSSTELPRFSRRSANRLSPPSNASGEHAVANPRWSTGLLLVVLVLVAGVVGVVVGLLTTDEPTPSDDVRATDTAPATSAPSDGSAAANAAANAPERAVPPDSDRDEGDTRPTVRIPLAEAEAPSERPAWVGTHGVPPGLWAADTRWWDRDLAELRQQRRDACIGGDGTACGEFAWMLEHGLDVFPRSRDALDAADRGCDAGDPLACFVAARVRVRGLRAIRDPDTARIRFDGLCKDGVLDACAWILDMRLKGIGTGTPDTSVVDELRDLCTEGSPRACAVVGIRTLYVDEADGAALLERACVLGDADACYRIGRLYYRGRGVAEDHSNAETFYRRGCDAMSATSCTRLCYLDTNLDACSFACHAGDGQACFRTARLLDDGNARYDQRACSLGYQKACKRRGVRRPRASEVADDRFTEDERDEPENDDPTATRRSRDTATSARGDRVASDAAVDEPGGDPADAEPPAAPADDENTGTGDETDGTSDGTDDPETDATSGSDDDVTDETDETDGSGGDDAVPADDDEPDLDKHLIF